MTIQLTADDFGVDELFAFAPTGDSIVATLEASTSQFPISFFYKADDGTLVHEFSSSGQDGADTDTVTVDGQTVYIDKNGNWWPESALTFKTEGGDVVKAGAPLEPLTIVDACKAIGAALHQNESEAPAAHAALVALNGCNWLDSDPCDITDLAKAKALARAAIRAKAAPNGGREQGWIDVCNKQGWNDHSQVIHLEGFIRDLGLMDALSAYAERAAAEENSN